MSPKAHRILWCTISYGSMFAALLFAWGGNSDAALGFSVASLGWAEAITWRDRSKPE